MGSNYLIIVDKYSNWSIVQKASNGAKALVNSLREVFLKYAIPDEPMSDGGPEYKADETSKFPKAWGIRHIKSSMTFPHSNC